MTDKPQEQLGLRLDVDQVPVVMEPPPFQLHSNTSAAAAARIQPAASTLRAQVLEELRRHLEVGGLTDEQLQANLGMGANTERPRRIELVRAGWVKDSGRRRLTQSGREAVVWTYIEEEAARG